MKKNSKDIILNLLKEKSALKQDVFHKTIATFKELKSVVKEVVKELKTDAEKIDKRVAIDYVEKNEFEIEMRVAGDVLIFHMHTNVFEFDKSHPIWKTSYVRDNPKNSYCGMISVYNFLNDSFKYNRVNDVGYLIARIFLNSEMHFFTEGKRQMGFLYNDFSNATLDKNVLKKILHSSIIYALDFDLLTPPFENMKEVTVMEIMEATNSMNIKTGKRLGFRFQADNDQVE